MKEYVDIFSREKTWSIEHNSETGFVSGIGGIGNEVFESIKESINKYLKNNSGSVIDFSLLKDAVDRHCDSVENDINTLTPTPLYCGLAGTMAGVIVGLSSLITTGSVTALLSSEGSGDFGTAANGVNDLLEGVAWAMIASIMGILLTTIASLLFKRYKLSGEAGKNSFLAWLQAKLLPELPSDTSDALNRLVKNLNKFNNTFSTNTSNLGSALSKVNESYRIQADIIQAVHDMDVMKMAEANVRVLERLQDCTDRLEQFNQYLDDIHGYTYAIRKFTSQFESEADRLHVLEEIRDYFCRHKAEIAKDSADVDIALKEALDAVKETACSNADALNSVLVKQAEEFKQIIQDEKNTFEEISSEINSQFSAQLSQAPMIEKSLSEISGIPAKLDRLIDRLEYSNKNLATKVSSTMEQTARALTMASSKGESTPFTMPQMFPSWMKWTILVSVILIAFACVANTVHNIWFASSNMPEDTTLTEDMDTADIVTVDTVAPIMRRDSVKKSVKDSKPLNIKGNRDL